MPGGRGKKLAEVWRWRLSAGENEKRARQACEACGSKSEKTDFIPPCEKCQYAPPDLMPGNEMADMVYCLCHGARDGFGGSLDTGALAEIMRRLGLADGEWLEIWQKIMYAESVLKPRDDKAKTMGAQNGR